MSIYNKVAHIIVIMTLRIMSSMRGNKHPLLITRSHQLYIGEPAIPDRWLFWSKGGTLL